MTNRRGLWQWFGWSILLTIAILPVFSVWWLLITPVIYSIYGLLIIGWMLPIVWILRPSTYQATAKTLQELREQAPIITWVLSLLFLIIVLMLWGIIQIVEYNTFLLVAYLYILTILWGLGSRGTAWRTIGKRLATHPATNLLLLLTTLILIVTSVELYLRWTTIQSHGTGQTLGSRTWSARYMYPTNSAGYRGREPIVAEDDQQSILVLGDSFVVGIGIDDVNDVFAMQLDEQLSDDYVVNLAGFPGISPTTDYVTTYPYPPDILVLSHFVNDIDYALPDDMLRPDIAPKGFVAWWVKRYYIPNLLYWNLYASSQITEDYLDNLILAYQDDTLWSAHAERLQAFITWAEANDAQLIIIIWPALDNIEASIVSNDKLETFFVDMGVPVIRMEDYVSDLSLEARTANRHDAHPSVLVHSRAAEALANVIVSDD